MKCPNCGHENPDIRLFCARCGEILPEKDESAPVAEEKAPETRPVPDVMDDPFDDVDFYRRRERARRVYEDAWPEFANEPEEKRIPSLFDEKEEERIPEKREMERPRFENSPRPDTYIPRREEEFDPDSIFDVQEKPRAAGTNRAPDLRGGRTETIIPQRDESLDPDDFFDVKGRSASFDRAANPAKKRRVRRPDEFEDNDSQSFAMRHMRGIVTLALLLFTLAIVAIWAMTPSAQIALARIDMAWDVAAYEELGLDAWGSENYTVAAHYFEQAYKRDPENSGYARYAAESWMRAENYDQAAKALRICIAADPSNVDYYLALMDIYYGYENLPDSDRRLVDEGYERTGDSRLKYTTQED